MGLTQVSTDGVKNDAITKTKIPANQIEASELADNAVDTNAIADQAVALSKLPHGDGSSDGKFLRANNGADPTFETVTGTTINSNADNRVITGSNTANTLNGETNVHVTSDKLLIGTSNVNNGLPYTGSGAIQTLGAYNTSSINIVNNENSGNTSALTFNKVRGLSGGVSASDNMGGINWGAWDGTAWRSGITVEGKLTGSGNNNVPSKLTFKINSGSSNTERFAITPNGVTFNGDTAAANALDDYEEGTYTPSFGYNSDDGNKVYSTQKGSYTKIGRIVIVNICVILTNRGTGSGQVTVSLPFAVADALDGTSIEANGMCGFFSGLSSSVSTINLLASQSTSNASLHGCLGTQAAASSSFTYAFLGNASSFRFSLVYPST